MKTKPSSAKPLSVSPDASLLPPIRFRVSRAFKALDDGSHRKWIVVAQARDLPGGLPLDANARVPNVVRNKHCREMRSTLLHSPGLWQILNSGIICTANSVEIRQDGDAHILEVVFEEGEQGIVNGGHSYAQLIHFLHGDTKYSAGQELREVLLKDARDGGDENLEKLATDDEALESARQNAREVATVQMEFVAPVGDSELLTRIARARNLTQTVEDTAFQNLAGRFELMKQILGSAEHPFGTAFVERVVWKTNQEVPEESAAIAVKSLVHILALMNARIHPPETKTATEVYSRSGLVVREFGESEGEDREYYEMLQQMLPTFLRLYDHIYSSLPEVDPLFPWDGKVNSAKQNKRAAATPFLGRPCISKVASGFVWPVFSAMRTLLVNDGTAITFAVDPFKLFDAMKQEIVTRVENFFKNQAHELVHQVGKDKEIWVRLDSMIENELKLQKRNAKSRK